MLYTKLRATFLALLLLLGTEQSMYAQDIDLQDLSQVRSYYLEASKELRADQGDLTITADSVTTNPDSGKRHLRREEIVRNQTNSLVHRTRLDKETKQTLIYIYKKPWYYEIGREGDEPYVLRSIAQYDDVSAIEGRRYTNVDSIVNASVLAQMISVEELLSGRNGWVLSQAERRPNKRIFLSFSNETDLGYATQIDLTLAEEYSLAIVNSVHHWPRPEDWHGSWDAQAVEENSYTLSNGLPILEKRRFVDLSGLETVFENFTYKNEVDAKRFELSYYGLPDPSGAESGANWPFWTWFIVIGAMMILFGSWIKTRFASRKFK